ncbi:MAG: hypothetical protein R8G66_30005 [Cytophagales bacterium]|nr:hypothetical protein [Cytophagales bacterium]
MAKDNAYDQYIADLKKREQELRDEIEKQSTQLENKVKTGLIIGMVTMILATIYFVFFRRRSRNSYKEKRRSKGNWIVRWIIETVSREAITRYLQARKAKFKDS